MNAKVLAQACDHIWLFYGNCWTLLLDEKSYEDILIYDVSYKILIGAKPLHIMFDKVNGFIRDYDGTKYLVLFSSKYMM